MACFQSWNPIAPGLPAASLTQKTVVLLSLSSDKAVTIREERSFIVTGPRSSDGDDCGSGGGSDGDVGSDVDVCVCEACLGSSADWIVTRVVVGLDSLRGESDRTISAGRITER